MFDVIIKGGKIIDPEASTSYYKSIGIINGRIACITDESVQGKIELDAGGLTVCPGFIDVHGHIDGDFYCAELSLRQGITTSIGGNCGLSPVDMSEFANSYKQKGFIINQAEFVGHSFSLRNAVGANDAYKPATKTQIKQMEYYTEKAFDEGASGLSFGLDYAPGSSFEEILALSRIAARRNKLIAVHTRVTKENDTESIEEVLNIARNTGASILISHFIYQYDSMIEEALNVVEKGISEGLDIKIDSGVYTSWATSIGTATFDRKNIDNGTLSFNNMLVASGKYKGQLINDDIYEELRETSPHECIIYLAGSEENIYAPLNKTYCMPSSDTGVYKKGEGHPQIAGTFPKYFNLMVNKRHNLDLIEAVRKASLLPAQTIGLDHKGRIKEGMDADIVIFNSKTLEDTAAFPNQGLPDAHPLGIEYVLINGSVAIAQNELKNIYSGKFITSKR